MVKKNMYKFACIAFAFMAGNGYAMDGEYWRSNGGHPDDVSIIDSDFFDFGRQPLPLNFGTSQSAPPASPSLVPNLPQAGYNQPAVNPHSMPLMLPSPEPAPWGVQSPAWGPSFDGQSDSFVPAASPAPSNNSFGDQEVAAARFAQVC